VEKYIIFDTLIESQAYSNQKAISMGTGQPSDVIQYWHIIRETKDGKWAVQCPDGTEEPEFEDMDLVVESK